MSRPGRGCGVRRGEDEEEEDGRDVDGEEVVERKSGKSGKASQGQPGGVPTQVKRIRPFYCGHAVPAAGAANSGQQNQKKTTDGGGRPDLTGDTPHLGWGAVPNQTWTGSGSTKNPPRWVTAGDWSPITARWLQWLPPSGSPRMAVAPSRRQGSTLQNKSDPQFSSGYSHNGTSQPRLVWKDTYLSRGKGGRTPRQTPDIQTGQPASQIRASAQALHLGLGCGGAKGGGVHPRPPLPLLSFTPASFSPW
ncbi:hypothetical protein CCHR01_00066 [Colletotrichum chrysophilum]|uniref:Uncharacterized protein n=1 Tax=Colletotrichum chrysophilum TaxID=1836956 RepID=A0AAD9B1K4_9PEZI|nr:hypothetical protein CCHR01_00066 [Colletotrichum chrysophilum]